MREDGMMNGYYRDKGGCHEEDGGSCMRHDRLRRVTELPKGLKALALP
jgi:hypothetical protein